MIYFADCIVSTGGTWDMAVKAAQGCRRAGKLAQLGANMLHYSWCHNFMVWSMGNPDRTNSSCLVQSMCEDVDQAGTGMLALAYGSLSR